MNSWYERIALDGYLFAPLIKDKVAYLMGRCRMLKQIGLSTLFRISYTFASVMTFIFDYFNQTGYSFV